MGIPPFCAVGEIGLDLYWSRAFRDEQIEAFRRQIDLALHYGLPIAVHTREAWPETLEIIRQYRGRGLRGVFHAFSDTLETYRELRMLGEFAFGIGGVVTFRKSRLAEVVREMDPEDLVLETDCPLPHARTPPGRAQRIGLRPLRLRGGGPHPGLDPGQVARMTSMRRPPASSAPARAAIEEPAAGQTTAGQTTAKQVIAGQATAGQTTPVQTASEKPAAGEDHPDTHS